MINRSSAIFWISIVLLFSCAAFYSIAVQKERGSVKRGQQIIENGAIVRLVKVIDGDSVLVTQEEGSQVPVRILGIKSFDAKIEKDVVTPYSHAAVQTLTRLMQDRPVRIMLAASSKDRYGRYIASLFVDDQDIGLHLVKEGLVLVYTVYPFPAMSLYLEQQELARAQRRGLWANKNAADRAIALARAWQGKKE
jgi:micrococcal nuclease